MTSEMAELDVQHHWLIAELKHLEKAGVGWGEIVKQVDETPEKIVNICYQADEMFLAAIWSLRADIEERKLTFHAAT